MWLRLPKPYHELQTLCYHLDLVQQNHVQNKAIHSHTFYTYYASLEIGIGKCGRLTFTLGMNKSPKIEELIYQNPKV